MAKILVTGGAGFIGSHLVDKLIQQQHDVLVLDNLSTGKKENLNPKANFYCVDICDESQIQSFFIGIDFVFHLAALARVPLSIDKPVLTTRVNILGTVNVFKASADAQVKRLIFASSSSVYGDQPVLPLQETMPPMPKSPYALQKWVGEQFAKLFSETYHLPIVSLRYFNVYGPRIDIQSDYSLVLGKFLRLKRDGQPFTIFGDGKQTRSFTYVEDVVEANILAMRSDKIKGGEIINIGSDNSYSIEELADLLGGERQYLPPRPGDIIHTKADISLAKELLGWEPKISFQEGIERTIDWFFEKR